jgi:hypothetical protein
VQEVGGKNYRASFFISIQKKRKTAWPLANPKGKGVFCPVIGLPRAIISAAS